jgi:cytochrome c peroxidase
MFKTHRLIFALSLAAFCPSLSAAHPYGVKAADDMDFYDRGSPFPAKVELGRNLFFDKILSGNLNISCASCHHPLAGTGDGLSLPVGEGGNGLAVTRDTGHGVHSVPERVPRNAPAIFNLGASEFKRMFHDGRVEEDPSEPSGFRSPAFAQLPTGLDNVLAVQAMFPVTSGTEMAGQPGENPQADAAHANRLAGADGVWSLIAARLRVLPGYVRLFMKAYPAEVRHPADIDFVLAANAIAAFEASAWRFDDSPYDRYLRGNRQALSGPARAGMNLFYGKAGCSGCHSGTFQTDHGFHAIAMPQVGPGKGDSLEGYTDGRDDFGRARVSGRFADRFRFRTPSLRNIALSAPYGHSGAFGSLGAVVRHHLDAESSLHSFDRSQVSLPPHAEFDIFDFSVMDDPVRRAAIADANELRRVNLKEREIEELVTFLHALTDPAALDMRRDVPISVPSGLPIWD